MRLSSDASQITKYLQRENIHWLVHWTCVDNIPLIRTFGGLVSKRILEQEGCWPPPNPGGNKLSHSLDRRWKNWNMVSLNYTPYTPMAYHAKREKHLCFFLIDPQIAALDGVYFTDRNATANEHQRAKGIPGLRLVNFSAIRMIPRPSDRDGWHQPVQAEVLVPDKIPLNYIKQIVFVSQASKTEGERLWQINNHPPFVINRTYFADDQRRNSPINFSYLEDLILTAETISEHNNELAFPPVYRFNRSVDSRVSLLAQVYSAGNARGELSWSFRPDVLLVNFESRNTWYHWPSLALSEIPDGIHHADYMIDGVRWLRYEFEV